MPYYPPSSVDLTSPGPIGSVTPSTGAFTTLTATSLALGGATIGSNALAVTGTSSLGGLTTIGGGGNSIAQLTFTPNSGNALSLGMANGGGQLIAYSSTGTPAVSFRDSSQVIVSLGGLFGFTNASNNPITTIDSAFSRISAGIIGVGTGAQGSIAGGLQAATVALGGATIGTNALAVTGTTLLTGAATISGSLTYSTAASGPILKQGANGRVGTFVCNGTTPVTVNNTSIAITDAIIVSLNAVGGTVGALPAVKTITAATGFTIAGTASDTSTYNYAIIKNA